MIRFNDILINVIDNEKIKEDILTVIKDDLYNGGVDNEEYSIETKQIKKKEGKVTNRVTLKNSGKFYNSFYLEATNDSLVINYDDEHNLVEKYGEENIFNLSLESKKKIRQIIEKELIKLVNELLIKNAFKKLT